MARVPAGYLDVVPQSERATLERLLGGLPGLYLCTALAHPLHGWRKKKRSAAGACWPSASTTALGEFALALASGFKWPRIESIRPVNHVPILPVRRSVTNPIDLNSMAGPVPATYLAGGGPHSPRGDALR